MRRLLDYAGIVIFVLRHIAPGPGTQNALSLLNFAEIVSSEWVFFSYSDDNICDSFFFLIIFFNFLDFIFALGNLTIIIRVSIIQAVKRRENE